MGWFASNRPHLDCAILKLLLLLRAAGTSAATVAASPAPFSLLLLLLPLLAYPPLLCYLSRPAVSHSLPACLPTALPGIPFQSLTSPIAYSHTTAKLCPCRESHTDFALFPGMQACRALLCTPLVPVSCCELPLLTNLSWCCLEHSWSCQWLYLLPSPAPPPPLLHSSRQRRTSPEQLATFCETSLAARGSKAARPSRRDAMICSSCSVR